MSVASRALVASSLALITTASVVAAADPVPIGHRDTAMAAAGSDRCVRAPERQGCGGRPQAGRAQGDGVEAGRHAGRARVRRAGSDHREVSPGLRADPLAGAAMGGNDLVRTARPIVEDLAERTRETVNIGVVSGDSVVYIDQVTGTRSIVSVNWVGQRTPLYCTSNGKVLLASMSETERARLLKAGMPRLTPKTITDAKVLRSQFPEIVARGYAQTMEELEEGLQRGRRADPWDEWRRRRGAQRVGPRLPHARGRSAAVRKRHRRSRRGDLAPPGLRRPEPAGCRMKEPTR